MKRYRTEISPVPTVIMSAITMCVLWVVGATGFWWLLVFVPALATLFLAKYLEHKMNSNA